MTKLPVDSITLIQSVQNHVFRITPTKFSAHERVTPFQAIENRQLRSEASNRNGSTHSPTSVCRPRAGTFDERILRPTSLCAWNFDYLRRHRHIVVGLRRVRQRAWDLEQRSGRCMENNHWRNPPQRLLHILSTICNGSRCWCYSG